MAVTPVKDDVQSIYMSEEEKRTGKYSAETLAKVLGAMHQDGLVVLKDVIPVDIIDKMNKKMCDDTDKLISDPAQSYNHGIKSNLLQRPPITDPEYLHKDVYFNKFVLQLANAYLGPRPVWNWLTANTALANTAGTRQPTHKDNSFEHPLFPYYFIANVPLCDFSPANGSTEFWLGSHAHTTWTDQKEALTEEDIAPYRAATVAGKPFRGVELGGRVPPVREEIKAERMKIRPPIQPTCSRGDVMIRDLRLWHAGMPNNSDSHRIMLALGYQSPSHPSHMMNVHLPNTQRGFFLGENDGNVDVRAQWYMEEDLAKTKLDSVFYTKPAYKEVPV